MPMKAASGKFSDEELGRIDAVAATRQWTRSQFIRVAVMKVVESDEGQQTKIEQKVALPSVSLGRLAKRSNDVTTNFKS